jgi:hypothetical protein
MMYGHAVYKATDHQAIDQVVGGARGAVEIIIVRKIGEIWICGKLEFAANTKPWKAPT